MLLKINGPKRYFWQWDLDRQLIVGDEVCGEVHFCNGTDDCAPVCEVHQQDGQRLVDVPNILLQTAKPLTAYLYLKGSDGCLTRHQQTFQVVARTKPADYVYTETEVKSWAALDERIKALEENGKDALDWVATKKLEGGDTVYIAEQKLSSGMWTNLKAAIRAGVMYDVYINGTVYTREARANGAQSVLLGNNTSLTFNDDPFCIMWAGGTAVSGMFFKDSSISSPVTLKVTDHADYVYDKMPEGYLPESVESVIIRSSTANSTKKFKLTVDDSGTVTATELT